MHAWACWAAYGGHNGVYDAARKPAPVLSALCWSHARRKFFELADIKAIARKGKRVAEDIAPIALEAVKRIDAIFCRATNRVRFRVNLDETRWWGCDGRRARGLPFVVGFEQDGTDQAHD